jgi:hypothetical protein
MKVRLSDAGRRRGSGTVRAAGTRTPIAAIAAAKLAGQLGIGERAA